MSNLEQVGKIPGDRLVARVPFYYGWVILAVGTLGLVMTSPAQSYVVSIYFEYFINDLGFSRSLVSGLFALGTLIGSFGLTVIGQGADRKGSRWMVVLVSLVFGVTCIAMGFVQGLIGLGLGFILLRLFGKGGLDLVSTNAINQWWVRRRGAMLGIAGFGMALLGIGLFPPIINGIIPWLGWRVTYVILGVMMLLIMAPLGYIFMRDRPETYGLAPDGSSTPLSASEADREFFEEENWTLREVLKSTSFWVLAMSSMLIALGLTGLFIHMVSIAADNGLDAGVAAAVFVPIGVVSAIFNLGSGVLADRMAPRFLFAFALMLQALGLFSARFIPSLLVAMLFGVMLGAASGFFRTANTVTWADYYGRRYLGSIMGVTITIRVIGTALGPVLLGVTRDVTGSYNVVLVALAGISILMALACIYAKKGSRPEGVELGGTEIDNIPT